MRTFLKQATRREGFDRRAVEATVAQMLEDIRDNGDDAIRRYARDLDKWENTDFRMSEDRIRDVERALPESFKDDIAFALKQVQDFARAQRETMQELTIELRPGAIMGHKHLPMKAAGCYTPGGKYPLVAGSIMSAGVAAVACVPKIIGCAPPRDANGVYPQTLFAFSLAGAHEIYALGGVQALAAMAYGLVGMSPVDLIIGPGNPYVAEAKRQLFGTCGIDQLAGPTETCIIADESVSASLVATDLLGQAEHGPDSPCWLITTSRKLAEETMVEIEEQLKTLPTAEVARLAWRDYGEVVVVDTKEAAVEMADEYASEHLQVMTEDDDYFLENLNNYGSLFVGETTTVAYGDKAVGTNHILPTGRASRYTGGLWVGKFLKTVTWQRLTPEASRDIAPVVSRISQSEGMMAHALTADVRHAKYAPKNEA
ncbi:MAG: histidinol dehydrogenase [Alphaproteobacteria bacterium]